MYPNNPMLNQQMAQLEQEFLQKKQNLMQNFYAQNQQQNNWNQQNTQQTTQPAQNVNWIYVSGVDGAKSQIVQPGHTAWMMDNNQPYIYVKTVDNLGSCEFHIFNINEVQDVAAEQPTQQIDMSKFVPRGEFDALKEQVEQLTNKQTKQPTKTNKEVDNG